MPKQAIALLVHQDSIQINALIDMLRPDFDIYVHIDLSSPLQPDDISCENVWKKFRISWGAFNMVEATVFLYGKIIASATPYSHIALLSGDSLPVKSNAQIVRFLSSNAGISFLENLPAQQLQLDRRRYFWFNENLRKKYGGIKKYLHPFKMVRGLQRLFRLFRSTKGFDRTGSQWTILASEHVRHLLERGRLNDYRFMAIPDESFVQNHFINADLPYKDNLIYAHWPEKRGMSPAIIDEQKFLELVNSPYLFARKFTPEGIKYIRQEAGNESASSR